MRRLILPIALFSALAVVSCGQNWLTGDDSPSFRIAPTSINGDTTLYVYSYFDGENARTDTLATFRGIWSAYISGGYREDWRLPPQYWLILSNRLLTVGVSDPNAREAAKRFIEKRGDAIERIRDYSATSGRYYIVVRLWKRNLSAVPADLPFLDALDEYMQRRDLFESIGYIDIPAMLMRSANR